MDLIITAMSAPLKDTKGQVEVTSSWRKSILSLKVNTDLMYLIIIRPLFSINENKWSHIFQPDYLGI